MDYFANVAQEWMMLFLINDNGGDSPPPINELRVICADTQEPRIISEDTQENRIT